MHARPDSRIHRTLARLGGWCVRRPWRVLLAWLVLAVALVGAVAAFGRPVDNDVALPGSDAQVARDLSERDGGGTGSTGQVVVHVDSGRLDEPARQAALDRAADAIAAVPHVTRVDGVDARTGSLSADGRTGYLTVRLDLRQRDVDKTLSRAVTDAAEPARAAGVETVPGGAFAVAAERGGTHTSELLGLAVAAVVLVLAFGGLVAAAVPLVTALFTLVCALSAVGLAGHLVAVPAVAGNLATMIGLGVGIDYALFLITRYRALRAAGTPAPVALVESMTSAGAAVVFAGGTVVIALGGLAVAGVPILGTLGWTAGLVVVVAVLGAVTLLPALLAVLGPRIDRLRLRRPPTPPDHADPLPTPVGPPACSGPVTPVGPPATTGPATAVGPAASSGPATTVGPAASSGPAATPGPLPAGRASGWARQADRVTRHPWRWAVLATVLLAVLAAPATTLTLGQLDAGDNPPGSATRTSHDLLAAGFGPGVNGPLTVVAALEPAATADTDPRLGRLVEQLRAAPDVDSVGPPRLADGGRVVTVSVQPRTAPSDPATAGLVHTLREVRVDGVEVHVGGATATRVDLADRVRDRMPWVIGVVVGLSTVLLYVAFRAPVVAVKAAVMNLVSIGAAYGVLTAVFAWGWGVELTGLSGPVPVESYLPMMLFALLFGLSMDYEVFLLTAVQEAWRATGDNRTAVRLGLADTGRVITSAALIMVTVFASFVLHTDPVIKMFGLGMAVAVAVDATVVRGLLVPATMALLGRANWWHPRRRRRVERDRTPVGVTGT
ncbi:MMPL family transporter [Micromonospora cathayae]|uniref:MMPL family transporter n=1 Tax=Micromonospora cathayae TaxID=3028804 RepID=A0ABY7ZHP1_9ACTN|nr:MMPL family transporter [Micromonospora sp. HUAS 3]WDZ82446.1 MMPL family transporter [Micromonospora sp. HUAS 3]